MRACPEPKLVLVHPVESSERLKLRIGDAASGVIPSLIAALRTSHSVDELWIMVCDVLRASFDADASMGLEVIGRSRLQVRATSSWPWTLDPRPFPVAPDSQAAFVMAATSPIVCDDLSSEQRFIPAPMVVEAGYQSSMTVRLEDRNEVLGVIGVYHPDPGFFSADDASEFATAAGLVAAGVAQQRRLTEAERAASHDRLTDLLSRAAVLDALAEQLETGRRSAIMLIDLDGFKQINDRHGHSSGDRVLQVTAERLMRSVGLDCSVGRLGGDEFLVVSPMRARADLRLAAERILGLCETILRFDGRDFEVSGSMGIATSTEGESLETLLRRADQAMYRAKRAGRGRYEFAPEPLGPQSASDRQVDERASIEPHDLSEVDRAIKGVTVVFQPITDGDGSIVGLEALARGPRGPLERPDMLFETATTFGRLGELELAAKRAALSSGVPEHVPLFLNLEPAAFLDERFIEKLTELWIETGRRTNVVAELTERALIEAPGRLLDAVARCREMGWKIGLDDVGARSDSLAALRLLRPEVVKLDMGLLRSKDEYHGIKVSTSVASYCDRSSVAVVAEGIESPEDLQRARILGANLFQGFHLGRPGPLDAAELDRVVPWASVDPSSSQLASKRSLLAISRHIEAEALTSDCVLLATLQRAEFYTPRTQTQYEALARRCGFVGVIGSDLHAGTSNGVRMAEIDPSHELASSWHVVRMSSTSSLALLAEEVPNQDVALDAERLFSYRIVTDAREVEMRALELFSLF